MINQHHEAPHLLALYTADGRPGVPADDTSDSVSNR